MDLKTYIADTRRRDALVDATGINRGYLWQIATGWRGRQPSPQLARRIESATEGAVSRVELRPDIFGIAREPKVA